MKPTSWLRHLVDGTLNDCKNTVCVEKISEFETKFGN